MDGPLPPSPIRIVIYGSGYVGLVSGACFAALGHVVTCVDRDEGRIQGLVEGRMPIFEADLDRLVESAVLAGRLDFQTTAPDLALADVVLIAVGTPPRPGDGAADLTNIFAVASEIAPHLGHRTAVVIKSTVPVGTGDAIEAILRSARPDLDVPVISNPEFLREGSAVADFLMPDRIVIGADTAASQARMARLYLPLTDKGAPIVFTRRRTAELLKYASNAFLATKISFINEMADLCEAVGADVDDVARGMGLDHRIGETFLQAGPGYGGSCFPKDTSALLATAQDHGINLRLVESTIAVNLARKRSLASRVLRVLKGDPRDRTVAVLGLTFKADTDDMRDAPSIALIEGLQRAGVRVRVYDPEGMAQARICLNDVIYAHDPYACAEGVDGIVLLTPWPMFRKLDLQRLANAVADRVFVDLRNHLNPEALVQAGFRVHAVGRPRAPVALVSAIPRPFRPATGATLNEDKPFNYVAE